MDKDMRQDSSGKTPPYQPGDRVWVNPLHMEATVIAQQLSWDYPDSFWGDVLLQYDDGCTGTSNNWQLARVVK